MLRFACIVEGQGDAEAVPGLVRRIAWSVSPEIELHIETFRFPRNQLLRPGVLESKIELVVRRIGRQGAILVILDADDDCPAQLGPELLERARRARPDVALSVVLAMREFEAWFLAAAESLRGWRELPETLEPPPDPEAIRGAKEWLANKLRAGGESYSETTDQQALVWVFDLELARERSASFAKCWREIRWLLAGGTVPR